MLCLPAEKLIKGCEALRLVPYLPHPEDVPTIGWGTTRWPGGASVSLEDDAITVEVAQELFDFDVAAIERMMRGIVRVNCHPNQWGALVSLVYNIGIGNFHSSTMLMKLNRADYAGAVGEFWKWRRSAGQIMGGLVLRRKAEELLFLTEPRWSL